uniref:Argininosuccinate lyase n=1 Tax=Chelativorans sp. (strain BNC1) TaxID=266779 RepID=UPI000D5FE0FF|nr:Chain A, Argininosuccinate lyase [Chelativorans sp. BNC1]6G3E_A Chain A, Argininosuccinate lyase [Chelativorans sp. BNC1]6G3F_A Chain A, Argininosuccinate lyase [Chelativorans sp. BNC1]6G3G_A Chain A, Argininosuccinate lyase [Chelativorans sp. BNC1]6G3H_A Chain A, Argininosuccinate lyase [Chelativorans sp. BNC1]6G3I_A Chain A, Argininosuccinate lyase [Chelativorans sp. BNC1]
MNINVPDATRIGRATGAKAPEFQELYDFDAAALTLTSAVFPYDSQIHRAHVVMLTEQGILTVEESATILSGLAQVDELAATDGSLRTYLPYEAALKRTIGSVAGKMHIGRSRNDLANAGKRMFLRDQLLRTIEAVIGYREAVVHKAADHLDTVMVVYTQRKEAQPITLGHYLMAISENLAKNLDRYRELYARINLCPLGAAATAGTGWPLNRDRTSALLGFDGLVVNSIEGVAGWDHVAEHAFVNAVFLSGLSRLASEIQLWSTDEYQVAELDASFAGTSSIMPQKKNPDSLERSRKAAFAAMGPLVGILTSLNAIEYQYSAARVELEPRSIDALIAATHAMTGVVRTLHPNKERMRQYAAENYSTMTDLTDMLVRRVGIDYREAHEIVAHVVITAIEKGIKANKIGLDLVQEAAVAQTGAGINVSADDIKDALDPWQNVLRREGKGMPAPMSVKASIDDAMAELHKDRAWLANATQALANAKQTLADSVQQIIQTDRKYLRHHHHHH